MKLLTITSCTIICVCIAGITYAGTVASAKSYGYRHKDARTYDTFVRRFSKKKCSWVEQKVANAVKVAGESKGTGAQVASNLVNNTAKRASLGGLLLSVGSNTVKNSAITRDAGRAVLKAKTCK